MEHDDIKKVTKEMEELLSKLSASKAPLPEREEEPVGSDEEETNFESTDSDGEETYLSLKNRKSRSQEARKERKREQREEKKARGAIDGYLRPVDGLWAAFCIPVVIMVIIFAQRGIFPFGEESFLRTDMYHQYAPFFSEFQYKLSNGRSLLYSWNIGMGINFSALYAYYLASPLNWLLILCPKNLVIEFMTYSIVLKIGLSGLSFAWYLRKHGSKDDFGVAFFGIFYALSGYGSIQLEYYVAGLYPFVSAGYAGAGKACERKKRNVIWHLSGHLHSFQLLYLHHDLHLYGDLFFCPSDSGKRRGKKG